MKHAMTWIVLSLLGILVSCTAMDSARKGPQTHLVILSGQSNMVGMDPAVSFEPTLRAARPEDEWVIVKLAEGAQPIRRWVHGWAPLDGVPRRDSGDLYDALMAKVAHAIDGRMADTVTFVWMQGERDTIREDMAAVYGESLAKLAGQLQRDLGRTDINMVIGRISDHDNERRTRAAWMDIREAQVEFAEKRFHATWVDTDDLNGEIDDLHYTPDGYAELGRRFAKATLALLE